MTSPTSSSTSIAAFPHDSGRRAPVARRSTRTCHERPSSWATATTDRRRQRRRRRWGWPRVHRAESPRCRRARATRRTGPMPATGIGRGRGAAPSSSAWRVPWCWRRAPSRPSCSSSRAKVWPQGSSTAVGAKRWPPVWETSQTPPGGASARLRQPADDPARRSTRRGDRSCTRQLRRGILGARERGPRRARGCPGRARPSRARAGPRVGDLGRHQPRHRRAERRRGRARTRRGPSCAGMPAGTPHEHEPATGRLARGVQLGAELAVEVRLARRVATPRAGLLDDDEEARRRRPCRRRWCRPGPTGPSRRPPPGRARDRCVGRVPATSGRPPHPRAAAARCSGRDAWHGRGSVRGALGRTLARGRPSAPGGAAATCGDDGGRPAPEPSRRPSAAGSSMATPLAAAARAGVLPAKASTRVSSPLRKRWQRTPPVARPFGGYSAYGVTLSEPPSVPGSAPEEPDEVTTTPSRAGSTTPKNATRAPRPSLMPAMPPAERPWGRTELAGKRSSWASLVTKTRSRSSRSATAAPTTRSPSLRLMTSQSLLFGRLGA